jgi:hypothetical protein
MGRGHDFEIVTAIGIGENYKPVVSPIVAPIAQIGLTQSDQRWRALRTCRFDQPLLRRVFVSRGNHHEAAAASIRERDLVCRVGRQGVALDEERPVLAVAPHIKQRAAVLAPGEIRYIAHNLRQVTSGGEIADMQQVILGAGLVDQISVVPMLRTLTMLA